MRIRNNSGAELVLNDGTKLPAKGDFVTVSGIDISNDIMRAWIDRGVLTVEDHPEIADDVFVDPETQVQNVDDPGDFEPLSYTQTFPPAKD